MLSEVQRKRLHVQRCTFEGTSVPSNFRKYFANRARYFRTCTLSFRSTKVLPYFRKFRKYVYSCTRTRTTHVALRVFRRHLSWRYPTVHVPEVLPYFRAKVLSKVLSVFPYNVRKYFRTFNVLSYNVVYVCSPTVHVGLHVLYLRTEVRKYPEVSSKIRKYFRTKVQDKRTSTSAHVLYTCTVAHVCVCVCV